MKNRILSPEDWLKENCKKDDWSSSSECLHDGLLTNNVIQYMKDYADYIKSQISEVYVIVNIEGSGYEVIKEISLDLNTLSEELEELDRDVYFITNVNLT